MEILSVSTLVLIITQLVVFAFGYGKLNQKMTDVCRRMDKLEIHSERRELDINKLEVNIAKVEANMAKLDLCVSRLENKIR